MWKIAQISEKNQTWYESKLIVSVLILLKRKKKKKKSVSRQPKAQFYHLKISRHNQCKSVFWLHMPTFFSEESGRRRKSWLVHLWRKIWEATMVIGITRWGNSGETGRENLGISSATFLIFLEGLYCKISHHFTFTCHGIVHSGINLWESLIQPPAQTWLSHRVRPGIPTKSLAQTAVCVK